MWMICPDFPPEVTAKGQSVELSIFSNNIIIVTKYSLKYCVHSSFSFLIAGAKTKVSIYSYTCIAGVDLDILFRKVDLLTDSHTYTHNYSINNIVSQSHYTPGP